MIIDQILQIWLNFSNQVFIIPVLLMGYIWLGREKFSHALNLLMLSIICNSLLKGVFKVPLAAHLAQEGYAFPSGHMQSSMVLYGYLALNSKNIWYKFFTAVLLGGIGFGLKYFSYHDYFDVVGGILFGALLLVAYSLIASKYKQQYVLVGTFFIASFIIIYIATYHSISLNLIKVYLILVGLMLTEIILANKTIK